MIFGVHPLIAPGLLASTAATDAAYLRLQRGSERQGSRSGGKLERHLLPVIGVCGDQLHRKRNLYGLCGNRLMARRVRLGHLAATGGIPRRGRRDCASLANTGAHPIPAQHSPIDKYFFYMLVSQNI
jgi:hypothetical protein